MYDDETYEKQLTHSEWSKEETDYLVDVYRECHGKWPVIIDHYTYDGGSDRSMEDLKSRFYSISATLLQLNSPITSMTAPEYTLYETLSTFNPAQEASRKKLAEGHLLRRQNEVDEESVLLSELQRIMLNQASVDSEREVCGVIDDSLFAYVALILLLGITPPTRLPSCQHKWIPVHDVASPYRPLAATTCC